MDIMNMQTLEYQDGATGNYYLLGKHHNFSDFLDFIPIPLGMESYPELVDSLEHKLLGSINKAEVSPAEQWLLEAYSHQEIPRGNSTYSKIIRVPSMWHPWPAEFPKAIYQRVCNDSLDLPQMNTEDDPDFKEGWLLYYGHNHRQYKNNRSFAEFEEIIHHDNYTILKSSHGLIMKKENQYAWIFHSNGSLTGGPSKLRWPSISNVLSDGNLVIVQHQSPIRGIQKVFIVSLSKGIVVELNLPKEIGLSEETPSILLENGMLQVGSKEQKEVITRIDLKELMSNLTHD